MNYLVFDFQLPSGQPTRKVTRSGFSLLEIAVVVVILLVLLAISIPIVRDMRTLTRRRNCDQNLVQLALALRAYDSEVGHLPAGTLNFNASLGVVSSSLLGENADEAEAELNSQGIEDEVIRSLPEGYHHNWISACLPQLDRQSLFQMLDFDQGVYAKANQVVRQTAIPSLRCPEAAEQIANTTCYVGIHSGRSESISVENDGLLFLNGSVSLNEIPDGAAYTILLGEKLSPPDWDLGWMSGTRSSLRNTGSPINAAFSIDKFRDPLFVGGLGSHHVDGASVAMADGSVQFLTAAIDAKLYSQMGSRDDGVATDEPKTE